MAEIRHLENRHDVIFSAEGGPIWIKFRRLVQNDMSTAVMWSKSKSDVEFQYMADVWVNSMACHPIATCHTAGCCHMANLMSWLQSYVSHCRVLPKFNGMSSQSHASHCRVLPLHCHDSIATCHIAGCNNSISHLENRSSPYFIYLLFFLMQFALWRVTAFASSPIHLFTTNCRRDVVFMRQFCSVFQFLALLL